MTLYTLNVITRVKRSILLFNFRLRMKTMRQQIFFKMLSLQLKKHNGLK